MTDTKRRIVLVDWLWSPDGEAPTPGGEAWIHIADLDALLEWNDRVKEWSKTEWQEKPFRESDLKRPDMGEIPFSSAWNHMQLDMTMYYEVFEEHEANQRHYRKHFREVLGEGVQFWVYEVGTWEDSPFADPLNEFDHATGTWK